MGVHRFVCAACAAFAAAIILAAPSPAAAAGAVNADAVAVIIGNKDYQGARIPTVSYAHRDADAVRDYLVRVAGYREANVVDLRNASQAQMTAAFGNERSHQGRLWQYVRPGESDVTVYYSGHGVPGLKDRRGYLLPVDADPERPEINGYPLDVLYANLEKLNARSVTVYIDACFSGDSGGGMLIRGASGVTIAPKRPPAPHGMAVIAATAGDQVASWDEEGRHGLFTAHLLEALGGKADGAPHGNGDGRVTLAEVKAYLDREMTYAARRRYGRIQEASAQGPGDALLAVIPRATPPPRPPATPAGATYYRPGQTFRDCAGCPEMVVVPAGEFRMGDLSGNGDVSERPAHAVRIGRPFAVGKYEVTVGQFGQFARATGYAVANDCRVRSLSARLFDAVDRNWIDPGHAQTDSHPVVCVSWADAKAYVAWLGSRTGQDYRLLSEAEWEYAARATSKAEYPWGDQSPISKMGALNGARFDDYENEAEPGAASRTVPVGSYGANAFGLFDTAGNADEWTEDCWNASHAGAPADGSVRTSGDCSLHVVRGGSWKGFGWNIRSATRLLNLTDNRFSNGGFRIARSLPPAD